MRPQRPTVHPILWNELRDFQADHQDPLVTTREGGGVGLAQGLGGWRWVIGEGGGEGMGQPAQEQGVMRHHIQGGNTVQTLTICGKINFALGVLDFVFAKILRKHIEMEKEIFSFLSAKIHFSVPVFGWLRQFTFDLRLVCFACGLCFWVLIHSFWCP